MTGKVNCTLIYQDIVVPNAVTYAVIGQTYGWFSLQTPNGYQAMCAKVIRAVDANGDSRASWFNAFVTDTLNVVAAGKAGTSGGITIPANNMTIRVFYVKL